MLSSLWMTIALAGQLLLLTTNPVLAKDDGQCNSLLIDNDPQKLVCVCDRNECGQIRFNWPKEAGQVTVVTSSRSGYRFFAESVQQSRNLQDPMKSIFGCAIKEPVTVKVDLNDRHQTILGWGGSFTDAAGINILSLSEERAIELMKSYYGDTGLQYNFGRVPISGADFSTRPYTYDDSPEADYPLTNWSLAREDFRYKIPLIRFAKKLMKKSVQSREELKLVSASWSPPAWMKTNNNLVRGSLIDKSEVYQSYVSYLMKFFDAYERRGIKFWGTSVQNEPFLSYLPTYNFNSLQLGADQTIKFISEYLGPALKATGRTKENGFHLMVGDDSLGLINKEIPKIMAAEEVRKYVAGLAFHWYTSRTVGYDMLTSLYETIKKDIDFMLMTEASVGSSPGEKKVDPGSWQRGELYASDIIEDLNRQTNGWIDWNLALNMTGGPNWSKNFVDSPILVDPINDLFYKQPMYYALAHFTRFFRPGSVRVRATLDGGCGWYKGKLSVTAVHREKTGHVAVTILNQSEDSGVVRISLAGYSQREIPPIQVEGKSLTSVVVKL